MDLCSAVPLKFASNNNMIEEKTANKNYPLPNPENRASDDVERIAAALSMIDTDLTACDEKISESSGLAQKLEGDALRIPSELVGKIETEVKDIAAKKYIVVNSSGTGFTTVEGGGGAGGKKGEVLIKKSDENFDTTWVDPRAILKKSATVENLTDNNTLKTNSFSILADEIEIGSDDIPQQGITPHQVTNSSTLDSFQTMPINRGTTRMYFTKELGYPHFDVEVSRADAPEPVNLTPVDSPVLSSEFSVTTPQGGNWNPRRILRTTYDGYSDIKEPLKKFE